MYRAGSGEMDLRWPGFVWPFSFAAFIEGEHVELLAEADDAEPSTG